MLEIFQHLFVSVAEEMGVLLRRTSFSANIKERRDYSCAWYDSEGQTVAMGDHMPVHLGAMPLAVEHVRRAIDLRPGDIAMVNDPFRGGTHLPDITVVSSVFLGNTKQPEFYVANRAHHADVGGMSPGSMPLANEIYQEGLRLPPIKIVEGGVLRRDLLDLVLANVRTPVEREGDLKAQLAAIQRGETRLRALVEKYGLSVIRRRIRELFAYSERLMRATIREIPDGEYRFEDVLEDDGLGNGPFPLRVAIRIAGDQAEVDFTGSAPQAPGAINANRAIALAATAYVFRCLLAEDVPFTGGLVRPIRVLTADHSVVNASAPAAMAAGNVETSQRIVDVLLGALAKALPHRIPAASSGTMNNLSFGGFDQLRQRPFAYYETLAGGMGAGPLRPGINAVHTHMTNSWNTPVEAFEHAYPVRLKQYRIRPNSGGRGRQQGGNGLIREWEFLAEAEVTLLSERRKTAPYGLSGGENGMPGAAVLVSNHRESPLPAKFRRRVKPGDCLRILTPGGGGFGI
ncbi:MAG TPA: hydantoinase B/oxoprolinase family protein [Bryobacteraceae bacterium]|nr:hydantoinase B/oxoprolinase family protein [Bryobacteraceae bacterium]